MDMKHPEPTKKLSLKVTSIKTAFLYILIIGLGLAALTSVFALLIGEFNSLISKSLGTIFILFTHSLLLLALLLADVRNQIGKAVVSTTLFITVFMNLITSTLGVWGIISAETAWRWVGLYFLALGGAFIITALLRIRTKNSAHQIATNTSIGFVLATLIVLSPWVLQVFTVFDPLYYRVVAALSILSAVSFLISIILRTIANDKNTKVVEKEAPLPNGILAIYIIVGVITAVVWNGGFIALIASSTGSFR